MVQIIALGFTGDKTHEFTNILQKTIPLSSIHTEKGDVFSFNYFRTHKVLDNNGELYDIIFLYQVMSKVMSNNSKNKEVTRY